MKYCVVGLGNPGEEYENTRHNAGQLALVAWKMTGHSVSCHFPEGMMNNSGARVRRSIKTKAEAEHLIVVHDDLDLPLGTFKISYNRGAGGHRGVASIIKALKTEKFTRLRIGITPVTPGGKLKKPQGEERVVKFILGKFSASELAALKKVFKKTSAALAMIIEKGRDAAMGEFN